MIYGIGTDIVETERIRKAIENYGERFLNKIFTSAEQEYCDSFNQTKWVHYAVRFAAKESFSKAIGTGLTREFKFGEISILNEDSGKPYIVLSGGLLSKYGQLKSHISLSHSDNYSLAYIILEEV